MSKNKGSKEEKNNNSNGNSDNTSTPAPRGKRNRDSGSEGSPNINNKKPLIPSHEKGDTSQNEGVSKVIQSDKYNAQRKQFIENQLKNKYNKNSIPPFIVISLRGK